MFEIKNIKKRKVLEPKNAMLTQDLPTHEIRWLQKTKKTKGKKTCF